MHDELACSGHASAKRRRRDLPPDEEWPKYLVLPLLSTMTVVWEHQHQSSDKQQLNWLLDHISIAIQLGAEDTFLSLRSPFFFKTMHSAAVANTEFLSRHVTRQLITTFLFSLC